MTQNYTNTVIVSLWLDLYENVLKFIFQTFLHYTKTRHIYDRDAFVSMPSLREHDDCFLEWRGGSAPYVLCMKWTKFLGQSNEVVQSNYGKSKIYEVFCLEFDVLNFVFFTE